MSGPVAPAPAPYTQAVLVTVAMALGVIMFAGVGVGLVSAGAFEPPFVTSRFLRGAVVIFALLALGVARPLGGRLSLSPPGASAADVSRRFLTGTVVTMALREAAGLTGGVVILLAGDVVVGGTLAAAAVLTMAVAAPRRRDLERLLREGR